MRKFYLLVGMSFCIASIRSQTLYDSFTDGNFTAVPVWGGNTSAWTIVANSDVAAGATGSVSLRLAAPATAQVDYLSSQVSSWGISQEWGVFLGRRAQSFTTSNQAYFWLYANEPNFTSGTIDGYRIAIGDDTGGDEIRLEYIVNGAVSTTVFTSSVSIANGLTDIGLLIRVIRNASGGWELFTSNFPAANGQGAIATDIPNSINAGISQGTGSNNSLIPTANGYLGVAALHSTGASAITAVEFDQVYFTDISGPLPVKFTDVRAYQQGTGIRIDWSNQTESDVINYEVGRSDNGGDFVTLSTINANRNDGGRENYSYFDATPLDGTGYYRIQSLEVDGRKSNSRIVWVNRRTGSFDIRIYPNPTTDNQVSFLATALVTGNYTLRVFSATGQQVFISSFDHVGGALSAVVQIPSSVKPGLYNLVLDSREIRITKPFIIR